MPRSSLTTIAMEKAQKSIKQEEYSNEMDPYNEADQLIPGLPNHLAQLCLSSLQPSLLHRVSPSWRRLIYSPSFPPFFSLYALLSPTTNQNQTQSNSLCFFCFDPISSTWQSLPNPPSDPPLRILRHHPSFISRKLPIQSVVVSGRLVLIAATTQHFLPALTRPLVFDPIKNEWFFGPQIPTPRRWCTTGSACWSVYVASGIGAHYQGDVARSVEKWDMEKNRKKEWKWEKMTALKDGRFSREAVEAVEYKGKLCMVNVKGNKTVKQGAVYNIETDLWEQMPVGMLAGWNGPAATDDEDNMYVVDEAKGALRKYDSDKDSWAELIECSEILKGAQQMAAGRGRVCAVVADGGRIAVVDVVTRPLVIRVVDPPPEMEVVSVHILPRMSLGEVVM